MSNLNDVIKFIGKAIYHYADENTPETVLDGASALVALQDSSYTLVRWPESQMYMEQPWFETEAILALGSEETTGSSAYFIPVARILETI